MCGALVSTWISLTGVSTFALMAVESSSSSFAAAIVVALFVVVLFAVGALMFPFSVVIVALR